MKSDAEKTDIIIFGKYTKDLKDLWHALFILKIPHSIVFLGGISKLRDFMNGRQREAILFLSVNDPKNVRYLELIAKFRYYKNLSIAVYDCAGALTNIEEVFAAGANIYIHKPLNPLNLIQTIRQVMVTNTQFASGNFNRETYFLSA